MLSSRTFTMPGKDTITVEDLDIKLDEIFQELERNKDHVLPALQLIQKRFRYLPEDALDFISREFDTPLAKVVGIATFYSQFTFKPQGDHIIKVCRGTACHIKGADGIKEILRERYGLIPGEVSDDGKFILTDVRCLGCCAKAPVMMIDDEVYGELDEEGVIEAMERYTG